MPIQVECGACRAAFRVKDEHAGKTGKCPRCKAAVVVPAGAPPASTALRADDAEGSDMYALADVPSKARAAPVRRSGGDEGGASPAARAAAPTKPTRTPAEILAAFRGEIRPVRPTLLYRLWILIVAGVMLVLPLVYLALVGLVAYAVFLHAVHDIAILKHVRNAKVALVVYVAPIVVGAVMVAFMLKPLFARPARREKARALDPSKEPLVFAFVDGVCQSVGSPRPSRIEVDCQVNASARLDGGRLAWLTGDLVLTIGLPLAAGLTLRQFAGVLAHEFGHFSQRAGMRLCYLIWSINAWFARVVYERDEWDDTLRAWSSDDNGVVLFVGYFARLGVWLTRRVLWVLMMVGRVVSSFLSRQMEFDADRYEARMVGGEVFAQTSNRLVDLNLGNQGATYDLVQSWQERRLPDDLPRLILANVAQVPDEVRGRVQGQVGQARTGLLDTHPANKDRIARARAEATEGVFHLDGSATDLFRNFDALAATASLAHYRAMFGEKVTKDQLYPVSEAVAGQEVMQEGHAAFGRFFLGGLGLVQPLPLPTEAPRAPADLKGAKRALVDARVAMLGALGPNREARASWSKAMVAGVVAQTAGVFLKVGLKVKPGEFGLDSATAEAAAAATRRAEAACREASEASADFEAAAARRLATALSLLESDAVVARVAEGSARRDEARALYPCAAQLAGHVVRDLPLLIAARQVLDNAIGRVTPGEHSAGEPPVLACLRAGGQVRDRLQELQWKLGERVPYPFEHAQEGIGLARFVLPRIPDAQEIGELCQVADQVIERVQILYGRVLGRLAVTAEEVERALGLTPLEAAAEPAPDAVPAG